MKSYQNSTPYSYDEIFRIEQEIYEKTQIKQDITPENVDIQEVLTRETRILKDKEYNLPQSIFTIEEENGRVIVGRKIWSILSQENKINAPHCSMITSSMLLGPLKKLNQKETDISVEYHPFTDGEKITFFDIIKNNPKNNIFYPFVYRRFHDRQEKVCSPEGWNLNPEKVTYLGHGEEHIRLYTREMFKTMDMSHKVIYDPACSTGQFLKEFKDSQPKCITIGHDLSQDMINYAKDFVDQHLCCNAAGSPLEEKSADVMFIRFLNSEIVSKKDAEILFKTLVTKIKKNGLIIVFGHTPVLLEKKYFEDLGLIVKSSLAYSKKYNAIFQYYVLKA